MGEVKKIEQGCERDHNIWLYYQNAVKNLELSKYWKRYIAELVFELCKAETEIGNAIINNNELATCDPLKTPDFLKLLKEKDMTILRTCVWNSQIKICLPMIEMERCGYITANYELLQSVMSSGYWDDAAGEYKVLYNPVREDDVGDPYELDIATLQRIAYFKKRLIMYGTVSTAPFIRMKEKDKQRINFISDLLNCLTHFKLLSPKELEILFDGHEKFLGRV